MKTILFQGDSITDANRSRDFEENHNGHGYATLAAARISYQYPGKYKILNKGIGGNRVVDILERINRDILNLKPDYMSLLIGVNDIWAGIRFTDGTPTELFENGYDLIIKEVKTKLPNIKIAILGAFVLKSPDNEAYYEEFRKGVEERAAAAKRIAEKHGLVYIPLQEKFDEAAAKSGNTLDWTADGVHTTPAGHEIIAREWCEKFFDKVIKSSGEMSRGK